MNNRARAIAILQQARETLAERLTDRILETEAEILADAEGQSYLSEIETIYEQLGSRLAHLSTMLSNMPPEHDLRTSDVAAAEPIYVDRGTAYPAGFEADSHVAAGPLALPPPAILEDRLPVPLVTLQGFAAQVQSGDLDTAARMLAELFDVDTLCARRCTDLFAAQLAVHPDLALKATRLRSEVQAGNVNGSLLLLWECFGLDGMESLGVLQALRTRFCAAP